MLRSRARHLDGRRRLLLPAVAGRRRGSRTAGKLVLNRLQARYGRGAPALCCSVPALCRGAPSLRRSCGALPCCGSPGGPGGRARGLLAVAGAERGGQHPGNRRLPVNRAARRWLGRLAGPVRGFCSRLLIRALGDRRRAVVDEPDHALPGQRHAELMGVHGEVGQRIAADRVEHSVGVLRDDLDMAVEEHPVARLRPVSVAERVPAVVRLGILNDGDDAG